jgi:short-subunit dehydrogenase
MPYTWSKAAIHSLAAGLQGELAGSGISVTVICPGVVVSALSEKVGWLAAVTVPSAAHGNGCMARPSSH